MGSVFEAGGDNMPDVSRRIAMAKARFGKLRNLWSDNNLHLAKLETEAVSLKRMQYIDVRIGGVAPDRKNKEGAEWCKLADDERNNGKDGTPGGVGRNDV